MEESIQNHFLKYMYLRILQYIQLIESIHSIDFYKICKLYKKNLGGDFLTIIGKLCRNICFFLLVFMLVNLPAAKAREPAAAYEYEYNIGSLNTGKEWGLYFPNPGKTPEGEETADYLRKYDAYFAGNNSEKVIYLTFDGGYEGGCTEAILDSLKKNQVPAAFFVTGNYIKKHPDIICRMAGEGHIVGNHTMSHPNMTKLNKADFTGQLSQVEETYTEATGSEMKKYYRPPCGVYNEANLKAAQELGYKTIFWSLCYSDYEQYCVPTKQEAFSKLIPRIHPGAVILLHSTCKTSALIIDELIEQYRQMGYEFKSLDYLTNQ